MEALYSPKLRTERLIVVGRIILAVVSLLVMRIVPYGHPQYVGISYVLLIVNLGYSLFVAPLVWASALWLERIGLITHIIDVVIFALLVFFTGGTNSPFFSYFIFTICCAALRWQKNGTLWTALVFLGLFIGMGFSVEISLNAHDFQLNRFIMRSVFLAIIASLLVYLTAYEKRVRRELAKLHDWPSNTMSSSSPQTFIRETLIYAAEIMNVPRMLMIWQERDDPTRHIVYLSPKEVLWRQIQPDAYEPLVAGQLECCNFLCQNATGAAANVLLTSGAGFRNWSGLPLHPELTEYYKIHQVVAVVLDGLEFQGRLLFLDKYGMNTDDLTLSSIVARQITTLMDQLFLQQRLQKTAAAEERIRMARDLHDGLLQTLTGIALQVETAKRQLEKDSPMALKRLTELQTMLIEEQRSLRHLIQKLKPVSIAADHREAHMDRCFYDLAETIKSQWGLNVKISINPVDASVPQALTDDIHYLLREALINTARHAQASQVQATIAIDARRVNIKVSDDGKGFPFQSQYDLAGLTAIGLGPKTLMERIVALNGQLTINSSAAGASLEMSIPAPP